MPESEDIMKTAKKQRYTAKRPGSQPKNTAPDTPTIAVYWRDEDFRIYGMQSFASLEQAQAFADGKNRTSVRYIYFVGDWKGKHMEADKRKTLKGHKIEQFSLPGEDIVYIDGRHTTKSFDEINIDNVDEIHKATVKDMDIG